MGTFPAYEVAGIHSGPDGRRHPHGAEPGGFEPRHLCLAYVKFEADGLAARHAYFPLAADVPVFAGAEFSAWRPPGNGRPRPSAPK